MSLDEAFAKLVSEREAKLLRPAASQIAAAVKEYGFLQIYVLPTVDASLAAAIVVNVLQRNNVRFAVRFTVKPPKRLEKPSLLLGYPADLAEELTATRPSALIGYGAPPGGLTHVQVAASDDSSVAALTAAVLSEVTIVGPISAYAVSAGYWRGLDRGKKGEFSGFEKTILDLLKLENRVEEHFTIRLFRWNIEPTEEALALTLDPYLPGITGNRDAAEKMLSEDPRLAPLKGKTVHDAPEHSLTVLGEKLYDILKTSSRIPRRASEIIGLVHFRSGLALPDLREAALALANLAEKASAATVAMLGVTERMVAASATYNYFTIFSSLVSYVEGILSNSPKPQKVRLGRIDATVMPDKPPSLLLADRILRKIGIYEAERVPAYRCGEDKYCSTLESILYRLNYRQLLDLTEQGCVKPDRDDMFIVVLSQRC